MKDHKSLPHDVQKFNTQIGQSATVQRSTETSSLVERENARLREMGQLLNPIDKSLKHMGSAALHVYWNETLMQFFVVSQVTTMQDCPEHLAISATKDFTGSMMEFFGQKRPKLRSGF